ncbi:MAG: glycosyltransferase family 4 protein [Spirosomataceae bacterium]
MKILLFHQYYLEDDDPGGSRWNEMTQYWFRAGHDLTVIAGMIHAHRTEKRSIYQGKLHACINQQGVIVHRVHVTAGYNRSFLGRFGGYISYFVFSIWAALFKAKGRFDVVIGTSPSLWVGLAGVIIAKWKRCPFILEIRDLWPESAVDLGVLKNSYLISLAHWMEQLLYRRSKRVIAVSPGIENVLIEKKNIKPSKIILAPHAVDFKKLEASLVGINREALRKKLGLEGYFVVLYVGAHGKANGLHQLLRVGVEMVGTPVLFVLIGEGMEKENLQAEVYRQSLTNFRFWDAISKQDIYKYISMADLGLVMLTKCETFKTVYSNKTFDYMACRIPVLMTIDGCSRTLIEQAEAGTYADPDDPLQIAAVIRYYYNNPQIAQKHGENGYQLVRAKYNRAEIAESLLGDIVTLVGEN